VLLKHTTEGRKEGKTEGKKRKGGYLWLCFFGVPLFTKALLLKWSLALQNMRAKSLTSRVAQMLILKILLHALPASGAMGLVGVSPRLGCTHRYLGWP